MWTLSWGRLVSGHQSVLPLLLWEGCRGHLCKGNLCSAFRQPGESRALSPCLLFLSCIQFKIILVSEGHISVRHILNLFPSVLGERWEVEGVMGNWRTCPKDLGSRGSSDLLQHQNTIPDFYQFCKESQKSIIL